MQVTSVGSGGMDAVSMQKMMAAMKKRYFEKVNANGDSGVDAAELKDLAKTTDKSAEEIVAKYDADKDGVLSATEFDGMMQEMKPKYRPEGMEGPPPPPPPEESDDESSNPSMLLDQLKSLVDLLEKQKEAAASTADSKDLLDSLKSVVKLMEDGKTPEAETALQNLMSGMKESMIYGAGNASSSSVSLLSFQA